MFAHEYGHDLGLPDHYDTGGGDNAVNWWTLMAQSRVSAPEDQGIGTRPADLGAWDKLQLGWLDYEVVPAGTARTLDLGPHEYNSAKAQGVVVPLGKTRPVVTDYGKPTSGAKQWWSGQADDYQSSLTRQVTLGAGTSTLKFNAHWNIEDCGSADACDYAFVQVDDGTGFKSVAGSITKPAEGNGIDGESDGWVPATFDLSSFAGKTVKLRFHYRTDPPSRGRTRRRRRASSPTTSCSPPAARPSSPTTPSRATTAGRRTASAPSATSSTQLFDHYYVASNRQYVSYDKYLQTGPYNFGFPDRPDWVEHFPYQDGLLVSYWDTSYSDNNESQHPGEGEILPVDAHPRADLPARRQAVARPDPDLRLAVRAREGRLVHPARAGDGPGQLHPRPGGAAGVRRPPLLLERGAAERRREGPERRREDGGRAR